MIPENITREHIIKALEEIDKSEVPPQRDSEIYDLEHNNKKYPPKYVISMANKYANHNELNPSAFSGGDESNRFLRSLGFTIINKNEQQLNDDEGVFSQQSHDFAPRLKQYLENKYLIKINEGVGRARLSFPSGTIVHVRGSIVLRDERGFYHLQEEDQKDIVGNDRRFFAAVFGTPERTFVFPKEALKTLFSSYPPTLQEGGKPKMVF